MTDREPQPLIGKPLPNADRAYVDPRKLREYALDRDSYAGRHKALIFETKLEITKRDWEFLRDQILQELGHHAVTKVSPPRRAQERYTWEVLVPITGKNQNRLLVVTAWEIVEGRPELKSCRVAAKSRQHAS